MLLEEWEYDAVVQKMSTIPRPGNHAEQQEGALQGQAEVRPWLSSEPSIGRSLPYHVDLRMGLGFPLLIVFRMNLDWTSPSENLLGMGLA